MSSTQIVTKQTYASPLSYAGSTRRLLAWARKRRWRWPITIVAILLAWTVVTGFYVTFAFFFWAIVPFRLIRRHQRKSLAVQQAQLEEMRRLAERQAPPAT